MPDTPAAPPRVLVAPDPAAEVVEAVRRGGGVVVDDVADADAIAWVAWNNQTGLRDLLHPGIRWVQLPSAGVDHFVRAGAVDDQRVYTTASEAFAPLVAEHALALTLAGLRRLPEAARARSWDASLRGTTLRGATVGIVGAGAIGRALIALLAPFGAEVVAVNRSGRPVPGARETLPTERRAELWPQADVVVIAAPATAQTGRLIDAAVLEAMRPGAWLVNIARGSLVDTDALVAALDAGSIAGAALDVTDPEPLPDGHPLWTHPRTLVSPHTAMPLLAVLPALAALTQENVTRRREGRDLLGVVDLQRGY